MPAAIQRDLNRKDWVNTTLLKSQLHPSVPTSLCVPSICGFFKDWHGCTGSPHSGQSPFTIKHLLLKILPWWKSYCPWKSIEMDLSCLKVHGVMRITDCGAS